MLCYCLADHSITMSPPEESCEYPIDPLLLLEAPLSPFPEISLPPPQKQDLPPLPDSPLKLPLGLPELPDDFNPPDYGFNLPALPRAPLFQPRKIPGRSPERSNDPLVDPSLDNRVSSLSLDNAPSLPPPAPRRNPPRRTVSQDLAHLDRDKSYHEDVPEEVLQDNQATLPQDPTATRATQPTNPPPTPTPTPTLPPSPTNPLSQSKTNPTSHAAANARLRSLRSPTPTLPTVSPSAPSPKTAKNASPSSKSSNNPKPTSDNHDQDRIGSSATSQVALTTSLRKMRW